MDHKPPSRCPVCDHALHVSGLACASCGTGLSGRFVLPALARLPPEHAAFVQTFVLCRGVIRDVERALGLSYPTVRARLDAAVVALESALADGGDAAPPPAPAAPPPFPRAPEPPDAPQRRRRDVLRQVEDGLLTPAQAARLLREL